MKMFYVCYTFTREMSRIIIKPSANCVESSEHLHTDIIHKYIFTYESHCTRIQKFLPFVLSARITFVYKCMNKNINNVKENKYYTYL